MRKSIILVVTFIAFIALPVFSAPSVSPAAPDSAYIFAYSSLNNGGRGGLHFAWSTDRKNWVSIGPEMRFLFCDYGRWGSQKRLVTPFLFRDKANTWHCVWSVNESDGVFAYATSNDLVYWFPQIYPQVSAGNCLLPEISRNKGTGEFLITWLVNNGTYGSRIFGTTSSDLKKYSPSVQLDSNSRLNSREQVLISGNVETGTVHKVAWAEIETLLNKKLIEDRKSSQNAESTKEDAVRFAGLKPFDATLTVNTSEGKKISDMLIGVFFEDINYAADGGLYAELIQNRDFEYSLSDKEGHDKNWNHTKAWTLTGEGSSFGIDSLLPVHPNNAHYAVIKTSNAGAVFANEGWDGIALKAGEKYDFSMFSRNANKKSAKILVRLMSKSNEMLAEKALVISSEKWQKSSTVLTVSKTTTDARLEIIPQNAVEIQLDMISLFPQKTFNNRKNGLRADLAQTIADIHPRFIRFPGGCVAHGDGIGNIYRWKSTIGPLESRKPMRNLWGYHQTTGLGYFEYFQYCEDIGAEPLPVLAAGVPCQNSACGGAGQQGGIPMCEMDEYVQDVLDLIEWANGDAKTKWGKKRAEAGHPKPFNLKYIGIGNEDLINDIFEERFTMIYKAVKSKYPEITVVGTVGPSFEGTDYVEGWKIADKLHVDMVDEHYYQSPGWFINNYEYYDKYDRSKSKVYLGEYAAHLPGRPNNLETALAEAHYLTAVERNADVVTMTSYAPLLAKEGHTQWNPDLIYFNNAEVKPTVGYEVQKLYGENSGNQYLSNLLQLTNSTDDVRKRVSASVVRDAKTNDLIVKLVNILPVEVNTKVVLENSADIHPVAVKTVLTGQPGDRKLKPAVSEIPVNKEFKCILPAYSFTVLRIKTK